MCDFQRPQAKTTDKSGIQSSHLDVMLGAV